LAGLLGIIDRIDGDLAVRLPQMNKARRRGLAQLSGVMLTVRSANLMELSAALPREIASSDKRYQFVERLLANPKLGCDEVSCAFAREVIVQQAARGQIVVLMLDQSHINDLNEVLMVSVRVRDRALPVAWRVKATQGGIGFSTQKELLDAVKAALPAGISILLTGDRFYGTPALIGWCQRAGWDYRVRLKGNLTLGHDGGEITTGEAVTLMPKGVRNADLCGSGVITNIGVLHEPGHPEPWIIAMNAEPGRLTTLDYGLRWGIEAMFSDFKSRGFGLMQSHIQKPDRLEKLILIMAIAMYWAVSCGLAEETNAQPGAVKKGFGN
jgi:Transposase DDE domain